MLADLCPCFRQSPAIVCQTSFRSCAGLWPNFGRSRVKVCPILCRLRTKLCPNFGRSRARLCPISFTPCPFPNLAWTLIIIIIGTFSLYKLDLRLTFRVSRIERNYGIKYWINDGIDHDLYGSHCRQCAYEHGTYTRNVGRGFWKRLKICCKFHKLPPKYIVAEYLQVPFFASLVASLY